MESQHSCGSTIGIVWVLCYQGLGNASRSIFGRSVQAKVVSIIRGGQWCWPRKRNSTIQFVIGNSSLTLLPNESRDDFVTWLPQGNGNSLLNLLNLLGKYYRLAWSGLRSTCHDGLLLLGWLFHKS